MPARPRRPGRDREPDRPLSAGGGRYQVPHFRLGSGSSGGVRKAGGAPRSSAPSGEAAAASRRVSAGRFHFSSTSLSTEVWSNTSDRTQSRRAYGETTTAGTRRPYLS